MEDAYALESYLPVSFKTSSEQEYLTFLWDAFEMNYKAEKYQFAFLAYHMLTMSCVYFNVWQIKQALPADFEKAMVGFSKDTEKDLLSAKSPFSFWLVNESTVLRFLKLIGCDNGKIGSYASLVKDRNNTAHSNGNVWFREKSALDLKLREILRIVDEIQTHSAPIIQRCYACFLEESNDPDDREYPDNADQIREILIHGHYLSPKDIEICAAFDIADEFDMHTNFPGIESLHQTLRANY
jgi:hypothetical protein